MTNRTISADRTWCIISDIDGTLSDPTHRRHLITRRKPQWQAFYEAMSDDPPMQHIICLLHMIDDYYPYMPIILVTGRPDIYRDVTMDWLRVHGVPHQALYMRQSDDHRADDIVKIDLLERIRQNKLEPWIVFDDRNKVVKMWRAHGIPCLQVAEGDF